MKKLFSKKIAVTMICFVLLVAASTSAAFAAMLPDDDTISPRASNYIASYNAYICAVGSGKIQIWFDVVGTTKMDQLGAATIVLKESTDGTSWTSVKTYRYADYSSMMGSNNVRHTSYVSYSGVAGRYYKANVSIYAAKSGGSDSRIKTTSSQKATS